jgi:phosphoribosyl 1,2-cyclic phosphodiesterase
VCVLPNLLKHRDVPVFANAMTAEATSCECGVPEDAFVCFENGQSFDIGPFSISPFSIPHDTSDPVGFLVSAGGETYFHGTDIGTPLDSIGLKLAEADFATLESNHDPVLLRQSGRHPSLIQRIAGPRGHLSNDQACELVRRFASPRLKSLALAHLSRDCNVPHIAEEAMRSTLMEMGRGDVVLKVLSQDETIEVES